MVEKRNDWSKVGLRVRLFYAYVYLAIFKIVSNVSLDNLRCNIVCNINMWEKVGGSDQSLVLVLSYGHIRTYFPFEAYPFPPYTISKPNLNQVI